MHEDDALYFTIAIDMTSYTLHVAYLCDITGLLSNYFWEQETLAIVGSVYIRYFNLHIELQEQHNSLSIQSKH